MSQSAFDLSSIENIDEVLSVFIGQIEKNPSMCEVLKNGGKLSDSEILDILEVQNASKLSFNEAAITLDLWKNEFDSFLEEKIAENQNDIVSYMNASGVSQETHNLILGLIAGSATSESSATVSTGKDLDFDFSEVSSEKMSRFISLFDDARKARLEALVQQFKSDFVSASVEQNIVDLGHIEDEVKAIGLLAHDSGAVVTNKAADAVCDLMDTMREHLGHCEDDHINKAANALFRGLDILWEIRTFIANAGSEKVYWENSNSATNFKQVYSELLDSHLSGGH